MMKRFNQLWRNISLSSKLAAFGSFLVVITVLALTVAFIQRSRINFEIEMQEQAALLLETLPITLRDQLYRLEVDELVDVSRVLSRNEDVTTVEFYDSEGILLVESDNLIFSRTPAERGLFMLDVPRDDIYYSFEGNELLAGRSIWLGNERIGAVVIGLSNTDLLAQINAVTIQSITIAALTLIAGVGAAFAVGSQITQPILALTRVASAMAQGQLDQRAQTEATDEVGQLATTFNKMAEAIQRRDRELRGLNANLEQKVAERTEALRERNEELLKATEEATRARFQAEEATRLKSQFLASMSHELRTPLNAIMGFSELLVKGVYGEMDPRQHERIERINHNAGNLLDMINQLLDLSKIEAGHIEIELVPVDIRHWAEGIEAQLEGLVKAKQGLTFNIEVSDDLPQSIMGDPLRLRQIAINLIANAVKFTEQGFITVTLSRRDDAHWQFAVRDTGIGIDDDALEYIFDEFRQVDGSTERKYGGTGLGLAIVKRLAQMMGGGISVESKVNVGSTFTVTLPLRPVTQKEAQN